MRDSKGPTFEIRVPASTANLGAGFDCFGLPLRLNLTVRAALLGGLVVSFVGDDSNIVAVRKDWPKEIRVIAVTPKMSLETSASRAALPKTVEHTDAVHNVQRSALFLGALDTKRYDLLWDA